MTKWALLLLTASAFTLFGPSVARAQTNDHVFRTFDWTQDVGAPRAAGLAGAFVGLADDSSAIEFNPAGLGTLSKTEVSAALLDRASGTLTFGDALASRFGIGFLSAAGPIAHTHLAVGVYVSEPLDERITLVPASIAGIRDAGSLETTVTDAGAAVAWTPSKDVHFGLRVNLSHLHLMGALVHPVEGSRDVLQVGLSPTGATKLTGALGLLVKVSPEVSVGAAYEQGVRWDADRTAVSAHFGAQPSVPFQFSSPSRFSGGFAYRVTHEVTIVGEADYVLLSRLHDTLVVVILPVNAADYHLDSGVAARGGVEWAVPTRHYSLRFRAGIDSQPRGAFQYEAPNPPSESVIFPGADRKTEGTLGASIGDKPSRYRFDVAAAFGGLRTAVSAGVTARF
jgi:hypothetical protein